MTDRAKPLLLDLFCGAGGAGMGYHRAGFDIVGVDNRPQPNYPFEFHQGDALQYLAEHWHEYDAIHASPPCHDHSTVTGRDRKTSGHKGTAWLLNSTIQQLSRRPTPWAVENVSTAQYPPEAYRIQLCGSSFGLDVRRHRWFVTNVAAMQPPCAHHLQTPRFRSLASQAQSLASVVGVHGHCNYAGELDIRKAAMGIDWMTSAELAQAIPPAYTAYVGEQLLTTCKMTA